MLDIIASIPPVGPSAQLLINYLLRYTTEITDGLQGYELGSRADRRTSDDVSKALEHTVRALDLLDRVWAAVLRGKMINLKAAKQHTVQDTERSREELSHPGMLRRDEETTGRYASAANDDLVEENRSVVGSRGYATVAQTQRIRLRNVLTLAKETLFTWMRTQLDAPPPPQIDGSEREARSERRELVAQEGDLDDVKNGNVQPDPEGMQAVTTDVEGEDVVLEDVDLGLRRPAENRISDPLEDEGEEQKHYTSLFEKTVSVRNPPRDLFLIVLCCSWTQTQSTQTRMWSTIGASTVQGASVRIAEKLTIPGLQGNWKHGRGIEGRRHTSGSRTHQWSQLRPKVKRHSWAHQAQMRPPLCDGT